MRPRLYACEEAKRTLRLMFDPAVLATNVLPLRLAVPPLSAFGFATLPRWARQMYGMPGSPLTGVAATAALHAARRGTTGLPGRLLYRPAIRMIFRGADQVS